jgi:hypothetical protein
VAKSIGMLIMATCLLLPEHTMRSSVALPKKRDSRPVLESTPKITPASSIRAPIRVGKPGEERSHGHLGFRIKAVPLARRFSWWLPLDGFFSECVRGRKVPRVSRPGRAVMVDRGLRVSQPEVGERLLEIDVPHPIASTGVLGPLCLRCTSPPRSG